MEGIEFYLEENERGTIPEDRIRTHYNDEGMIESFGEYKDGFMEGMWRFFREDGSLLETGDFVHSQKDGLWITYD